MLLFLDFDGVLHGLGEPPFVRLPRLESILRDHPRVEVVLSTSWREAYGLEKLKRLFSPNMRGRVIGQTPVIDDPYTPAGYRRHHRYREVMLYLEREQIDGRPWLALEDDRSNFPENLPNVVWCRDTTGLDDAAVARLRGLLASLSG